jgi:hypothetical protein
MCLRGAIVGCCVRCQGPVGIAHQYGVRLKVLFIRKLPLSESCVRELPLCLHCAIVDTGQRRVRWVLFVGELP